MAKTIIFCLIQDILVAICKDTLYKDTPKDWKKC